jgi:hypothetical protein
MVDALRYVGLFWLAFNVMVGGTVVTLIVMRAVRRTRRLRASSVVQLMLAHRETRENG